MGVFVAHRDPDPPRVGFVLMVAVPSFQFRDIRWHRGTGSSGLEMIPDCDRESHSKALRPDFESTQCRPIASGRQSTKVGSLVGEWSDPHVDSGKSHCEPELCHSTNVDMQTRLR